MWNPGVPEIVSNAVISELRKLHFANFRVADERKFYPNRKMFFCRRGLLRLSPQGTQ